MTPEGKIKAVVKKLFKEYGSTIFYYMPVPSGFGKQSLDFIGCYKGKFFAIETKAGDKGMTKKQSDTAEEMESAGGKVFLVNAVEGLELLTDWLNTQ